MHVRLHNVCIIALVSHIMESRILRLGFVGFRRFIEWPETHPLRWIGVFTLGGVALAAINPIDLVLIPAIACTTVAIVRWPDWWNTVRTRLRATRFRRSARTLKPVASADEAATTRPISIPGPKRPIQSCAGSPAGNVARRDVSLQADHGPASLS